MVAGATSAEEAAPLFQQLIVFDMVASIREVKKQYEDRLLKLPGVVSVGIGLDQHNQPAIIIGLDAVNPDTEAQLPSELGGYPVVIKILGPIKAQ